MPNPFSIQFYLHDDGMKLGCAKSYAGPKPLSIGGLRGFNRTFNCSGSEERRPNQWCRGGELNSLRRPFQGRALPVSYPGNSVDKRLYGRGGIEARAWRNCLRRKISGAKNYFGAGGNFECLTGFLISSQTKMQNNTPQISVVHHGPIGTGNKTKRSHLRQPSFFHQMDAAMLAFFVADSIVVVGYVLATMVGCCFCSVGGTPALQKHSLQGLLCGLEHPAIESGSLFSLLARIQRERPDRTARRHFGRAVVCRGRASEP